MAQEEGRQVTARMRQGLALEDRMRLRTETAERLIRQALERSTASHRSPECRAAMQLTGRQLADPEASARAHKSCTAEEPGGKGCLCECHDLVLAPAVAQAVPSGIVSFTEKVFE